MALAASLSKTFCRAGRRLISQVCSDVAKPILSFRFSTSSGAIPRIASRKMDLLVPFSSMM